MVWIDSVLSVEYQTANTAASATEKNTVDTKYGTPSSTCRKSAAIVPKIGDHRHRQPVDPRVVATGGELQRQRDRQTDSPERDRDDRGELVDQEVRGRLPHAGGQDLGDPEDGRDLGDLAEQAQAWRGADRRESTTMLQLDSLTKRYGDLEALHDLSFKVTGG